MERNTDGFAVTQSSGEVVLARRVLVTTGLVDELPDIPGLYERWGRDVLHCPYCHGWEVRDKVIGVLATGPMAVHQALLFRQLSSDVTYLSHTAPTPTGEDCTDVPGVWVAGNVTDMSAQVGAAAAAGALAGAHINADLVAEEARVAMANRTVKAASG